MTHYQRPGRRPGFRSWRRDACVVLVFIVAVGVVVMRLVTGVSLLDAAQVVAEERHFVGVLEREVDRERVGVEQMIALARIEPRARECGLVRIEADAVMLLTASALPQGPRARPLGAPSVGARGSWFQRAWDLARVSPAVAAVEQNRNVKAGPGVSPSPLAAGAASAPPDDGTDDGGSAAACDVCRARAAGRSVSH